MKNDKPTTPHYEKYLTNIIPQEIPLPFKPELASTEQLIHRGIFSPDYQSYYFTLSDKQFTQFEVLMIEQKEGQWSLPQKAFFNSEFMEHGMSFSSDGKTLFFASTRPIAQQGVAATWHIWKTELKSDGWSEPSYVDIPNLRDRLCSHPCLAADGTLYYHSSKPDYSEMDLYCSRLIGGQYGEGKKLELPGGEGLGKCTPYISANGKMLLFALLGESLDLAISYQVGEDVWGAVKKLPVQVNVKGQGNPYLSPDGQFLFYTAEHLTKGQWELRWVDRAVLPSN